MIAVEDAIAIILESTAPLPAANVPLATALGLVLAVDVHARRRSRLFLPPWSTASPCARLTATCPGA